MKKKLFAYGIYMLGISSVISALIVICTSSLLLASKDIKYKNGVVESEVIVMHDGKQVYATHNYSEIQLQNILLPRKTALSPTAKTGSSTGYHNRHIRTEQFCFVFRRLLISGMRKNLYLSCMQLHL